MKKTMLTYKTLDRFEAEYKTEQYAKAQIEAIEMAAYIANMNQSAHRDWTDDDIFADFLRILDIDRIETVPARTADGIPAALAKAMQALEQRKDRSAWDKGVTVYALEMVEQLAEAADGGYLDADDLLAPRVLREALLNGADDWHAYSWGGWALIYNGDIASRLCCPSELKRTRNGERRPNSREEWLDTQARALFQAANRVYKALRSAQEVQQ